MDVIVVAYRCRELLLSCCAAVTAAGDVRLVVVDNASDDDSAAAVRAAFPAARVVVNDHNVGFAAAVNQGIRAGNADAVLLLNPDARIDAPALGALGSALDADEETAAVGPRIRTPEGGLELSVNRTMSVLGDARVRILDALHAGGRGPLSRVLERLYSRPRQVSSLSAACLLLRRRALEDVGGLDERFFLYAEDVDLCLRLRHAGWRLRYEPRAEVTHVRGASAVRDPEAVERAWRASQIAFYRKHRSRTAVALLGYWIRARYRLASRLGAAQRRERARRMLAWLRETRP